jgi:hypothetical protein
MWGLGYWGLGYWGIGLPAWPPSVSPTPQRAGRLDLAVAVEGCLTLSAAAEASLDLAVAVDGSLAFLVEPD